MPLTPKKDIEKTLLNPKLEKILLIIDKATPAPEALKNIHAKFTKINVVIIFPNLDKNAEVFIFNVLYSLFLYGLIKSPTTWYPPCNPPHITKFQLAPCHNPLARKVIIMLGTFSVLNNGFRQAGYINNRETMC
jgi:hypothetical protein